MIETLYGLDLLDTPKAFFAAFAIGLSFGFFLERAGFGSSRKLTGIFYFRDMSVLKVMFTALLTAMLGLSYFEALGWIAPNSVYLMPSIYGAQIVGGLLFGVGFRDGRVVSGNGLPLVWLQESWMPCFSWEEQLSEASFSTNFSPFSEDCTI